MTACRLCGGGGRFSFQAHRTRYWRCATCGSYCRERGDPSRIQFNQYGEEYGMLPEVKSAARRREALWPLLVALIDEWIRKSRPEGLRGARLLDVGCGYGGFLSAAAERGAQVRGIELNPAMIEACHARGLMVDSTPLDDYGRLHGTFDVITFWNVLDSVSDPASTLRAAVSLLEVGGVLCGRVPNGRLHGSILRLAVRIPTVGRFWVRKGISPLNEWLFSAEGLRICLRRSGVSTVEIVNSPVPHRRGLALINRVGIGNLRLAPSLLFHARKPAS